MGDQDERNAPDERGAGAEADSNFSINPRQHSERGINPVQHSERGQGPSKDKPQGDDDASTGDGTGGRAGEYK